ncbi:MAG: hypothetical protein ACREEB_15315 [Caulobacteraceae bacterium]
MKRSTKRWGGAAAALIVLAAGQANGAAGPFLPNVFMGARLGTSVKAWRSLPPPPGVGLDATPACSNEVGAARVPGFRLSATEAATGVVACAWVSRFGHTVLSHSVKVLGAYRTSDLAWLFTRGRLSEIRFATSIDAYDALTGRFDKLYGRPVRVVRDRLRTSTGRLPRVRETWHAAAGTVVLEDPMASDPTLLRVRFTGRRA